MRLDYKSMIARRLFSIVCVALGIISIIVITPTPAGAAQSTQCHDVSTQVTAGPQSGPLAGTLCVPPGADKVQLLVHGWTYDRHYFDSPYKPDTYSYARAANKAGYATLAIDRIGSGSSLHPLSVFNTFNTHAKSVHKAVQALRKGEFGTKFDKVVSVGHSYGSLVTATEAGQYRDVDAMITTGFSHPPNYTNVFARAVGPGPSYPAFADPKFSKANLDPLYWTTTPGYRKNLYNPQHTDPAVIQSDENLKQTQSLASLVDVPTHHLINSTRTLDIPVFVVTGQRDRIFCGLQSAPCSSSKRLANYERQWYAPGADINAHVVRDAGHNVQLEKSSPEVSSRMLQFVDNKIGNGSGAKDSNPGIRPAPKPAPTQTPGPVSQATNKAFVKAVSPLVNDIADATNIVPGIGNQDDNPGEIGNLLARIGNINDRFLHNLPKELLSNESR